MSLTTEQQMLVEQRVTNDAKSPVVAYLLLIFLGGFGAHRFYLGKTGTAITMLILFVLGWLTLVIVIGIGLLIAVGIWWIVDIFLLPGLLQADKDAIRQRHSTDMLHAPVKT
ncbi:TM2 domain-containing protein [Pontibaca methylaminivorans]|uniref:TM2 domain-containing membrane protein YozV n=1 Tax=Pontibaca methylaminivorans TaxID=515897 RepID=A0A1R3X7Z4_9RHOB|nr:TM2 domain-containing protein [Pontibaca methylaminivorans]SIT87003.1 TM2 domain-containing membrane protein YozV [Pontibaca methylaminivorans]